MSNVYFVLCLLRSICRNIVELSEKMSELATQPADQDGRDIESELEQLTDELQKEQQELKRIKTITRCAKVF